VPSANAIFFNGDRVEGTGNPVIERLSDLQKISEILVKKFGGSINAWVIEASVFNGPFAVYEDFIPSVNQWGEPKSYSPLGFPASRSTVTLLSNCLNEVCLVANLLFHSFSFFSFFLFFLSCFERSRCFILFMESGKHNTIKFLAIITFGNHFCMHTRNLEVRKRNDEFGQYHFKHIIYILEVMCHLFCRLVLADIK
jgi:hypothetical protein